MFFDWKCFRVSENGDDFSASVNKVGVAVFHLRVQREAGYKM
jgi:hypothetical protein